MWARPLAAPCLSSVLGSVIKGKFVHNGLAKTGCAVRNSIRSLFRRLRSATLMHLNTRSRTFRCWWSFMVRSAVCESFHLPRYLLLPSKCSGALWTSILNRPSCSVPLRFVRCSKTDRSTFLGTSANVVEPNSTCSASNKFEMILNGVLELKLSTHPHLPRPGRISVTVG